MKILIPIQQLSEMGSRSLVPIECEICKETFYRPKNTVLRGLKGTREVVVCSKPCKTALISQRLKNYYKNQYKVGKDKKETKYSRVKKELVEIAGGKCVICGYNKCLSSLHFHHKNPQEKTFAISRSLCRSRTKEELLTEINKCLLVCSNCHGELHEGLMLP